nr:retrotransposon protein, putative, Ty1-copia subclass [Tanacetum cinerariifolium]
MQVEGPKMQIPTKLLKKEERKGLKLQISQSYKDRGFFCQCGKVSKADIGSTKSLLKREFDIKDLEEAKKILGMEIVSDRSRKILRVSQSGYISKILNNFRIDNGKSVQMPLGGHFKLSLKDCSIRDCDVERMSKVPYANAVGSLIVIPPNWAATEY